jgi:hypothetical protein
LYRSLELRSEDEVLVFLVAHEAFHCRRKTRQVEGHALAETPEGRPVDIANLPNDRWKRVHEQYAVRLA